MAAKDFEAVKAAALARAPELLQQWLGGQRHGNEWHGARKADGGPGDSWKVNLDTGIWANFSGSETGGDLIDLYAARNNVGLGPACDKVAELVGINGHSVNVLPTRPGSAPTPCEPIPAPTPPLPAKFGKPSEIYRYGDAFIVARYESEGKKTFKQFTWRRGHWQNLGFSARKPLYRAEHLAARPSDPVLLVEGEKCVHAAAPILPRYIVMTWAGGASSVKNNDWDVLGARNVIIWPDADDAGFKAAAMIAQILAGNAATVRVVPPPVDSPQKWDLANAIEEGWDAERIESHLRADAPAKPKQTTLITADEQTRDPDYPFGVAPRSAVVTWSELGLAKADSGAPHATLSNGSLIIRRHPAFRGRIWLDSFRQRIYHTLDNDVPREWKDSDLRRVTAFIQESLRLHKFSQDLMKNAVVHAAECNAQDSVVNWLNSLEWDGIDRLDDWLVDSLGVDKSAYTMAVSRNWPISMVARAYDPGCQVDTMPVLEDRMGEGKSSFLKILGGEWYGSISRPIGDKDFLQDIQGLWLVEIPDMTGFGKREHSLILATITTLVDRFRVPYASNTENFARRCVFAATSETSDWLQEVRGSRRFWPLRCGRHQHIDLDNLRANRVQIFAQAVAAYRAGDKWHKVPEDEATREQMARASADAWTDKVLEYIDYQQPQPDGRLVIYPDRILRGPLEMPVSRMDDQAKKRVAKILTAEGWESDKYKGHRCWIKKTNA